MLNQAARSFSRYATPETTIHIVCCAQRTEGIAKLLKKGVAVRYLVVPSTLTVKLPRHEKLEQRLFRGPEPMRIFHFAYAENPSMLWLEHEHLSGSLKATNCEWVPPELAFKDPRLETLKGLFNTAWNIEIAASFSTLF